MRAVYFAFSRVENEQRSRTIRLRGTPNRASASANASASTKPFHVRPPLAMTVAPGDARHASAAARARLSAAGLPTGHPRTTKNKGDCTG